jgi:prepilin-type N-terminal cleavage/methylation domain-containing protein
MQSPPDESARSATLRAGFTLIELSIVLVIIGLLVGGALVGRDLIKAAEVRATITQIEKYNTAVNTFRGKYGYLPGDINATAASRFGFAARGAQPGEGDGNGVIEANSDPSSPGSNVGYGEAEGETGLFWVDLSQAGLIEGTFNTATAYSATTITTNLNLYFPAAKLGGGNYVYVWSGGANGGDGNNYFGLKVIGEILAGREVLGAGATWPPTTISVSQAYAIDTKVDDSLPQSGRVTAVWIYGSPSRPRSW